MIEKIIYDYLKTKLSCPVYMELPNEPKIPFVWLEKTSSGYDDHIFSATIAVQSYGESLYKTAELNDAVVKAMLDCIEVDKISKCDLNSDYNFPDTERKMYRYQALFDLTYLK